MVRFSMTNQNQEKKKPKRNERRTEMKLSKRIPQSRTKRLFQNKNHVNKLNANENTTSGQSYIHRSNVKEVIVIDLEMNRENLYHWGATREIIEIIRRRNMSPETRRLFERRETLTRSRTMRRRYDPQSRRTLFAPSRT